MIGLIVLILTVFHANADQASDLAKVNKCFNKAQKLSSKLNHRRPATSDGVRSYRRMNNHCIRLSALYENRYEHLIILNEIEEEMSSAR